MVSIPTDVSHDRFDQGLLAINPEYPWVKSQVQTPTTYTPHDYARWTADHVVMPLLQQRGVKVEPQAQRVVLYVAYEIVTRCLHFLHQRQAPVLTDATMNLRNDFRKVMERKIITAGDARSPIWNDDNFHAMPVPGRDKEVMRSWSVHRKALPILEAFQFGNTDLLNATANEAFALHLKTHAPFLTELDRSSVEITCEKWRTEMWKVLWRIYQFSSGWMLHPDDQKHVLGETMDALTDVLPLDQVNELQAELGLERAEQTLRRTVSAMNVGQLQVRLKFIPMNSTTEQMCAMVVNQEKGKLKPEPVNLLDPAIIDDKRQSQTEFINNLMDTVLKPGLELTREPKTERRLQQLLALAEYQLVTRMTDVAALKKEKKETLEACGLHRLIGLNQFCDVDLMDKTVSAKVPVTENQRRRLLEIQVEENVNYNDVVAICKIFNEFGAKLGIDWKKRPSFTMYQFLIIGAFPDEPLHDDPTVLRGLI